MSVLAGVRAARAAFLEETGVELREIEIPWDAFNRLLGEISMVELGPFGCNDQSFEWVEIDGCKVSRGAG